MVPEPMRIKPIRIPQLSKWAGLPKKRRFNWRPLAIFVLYVGALIAVLFGIPYIQAHQISATKTVVECASPVVVK